MKRILTFSAAFALSCNLFAQPGLTSYSLPPGYTTTDLRFKNDLACDNAGKIYLAFRDIGLGVFTVSSQSWTMYDASNSPIISDNVVAVETQGTNVWVGTGLPLSGGSHLLRLSNSTWTDFSSLINTNQRINEISVAPNGTDVWIATDSGAYKYDGSAFTLYTQASSQLPSDTVNAVRFSRNGEPMFATTSGIAVLSGSSWTVYTGISSGLPSVQVYDLYDDARNGFWAATNNGAAVYSGTRFDALQDLYPSPSASLYNPVGGYNPVRNITRGPNGGILLPLLGQPYGVSELRHDTIDIYEYSSKLTDPFKQIHCADASGTNWIVNTIGTTSQNTLLHAFNGNGYYQLNHSSIHYNNARYLDVNDVRAAILTRGDMHWNGSSTASYEVPKGSEKHTVFASSMWLGGLDAGNQLHTAAMTYRQTGCDFFPGPLDTIIASTDSVTSHQYDRIWKISRPEILAFQYHFANGNVQNGSYRPSHDFLSWPAHGPQIYSQAIAPFVDVNGNGIYDPLTGGDYPKIKGDQMLYTIFNDKLAPHTETGGLPFGIEVHLSAYAFLCDSINASDSVLNYTTYYQYDVVNRSSFDYHDVYFTRFQDSDLGFYGDDYVGCYAPGNFGYVYNGDVNDGSSATPGPGTYGAQPPFSSYVVLDGPWANANDGLDNDNDGTIDEVNEKNLLTNFHYYNNDFSVTGNPQNATDFYNYMHSYWKDGSNVTYGGTGYGGVTPTRFMFDGEPYDTTWNETTAGNIPADRRMLLSAGPFLLEAGQTVSYTSAVVYSRSMSIPFGTPAYFNMVKTDVSKIQNWYANSSEPSCTGWTVGVTPVPQNSTEVNLFPNPAHNSITLETISPESNLRYEIFDITGRKISSSPVNSWRTEIDLSSLENGIFLLRVTDGKNSVTKKFVRN